ncbi:MAG TPA: HD domain-containing protein, partial [Thermomicrobiales bacterium]|nr:HD domain-containing protein [Thermomicrobiales bacterium]
MMTVIPIRARVGLVVLAALVATVAGVEFADRGLLTTNDWWVLVALCVMIVVVERIDVTIPVGSGSLTMSIGAPIAFAAGLHFGIGIGALIVLVAHLIDSTLARRDPIKSLTNISTHVLATCVAAGTFALLAEPDVSVLATPRNVGAVLIASLVFFLVNSWTFAFIVGPVLGLSPAAFWHTNLKLTSLDFLALPTMGGLVSVLAEENALALLLFLLPLLLPQVAYRALHRAEQNVREAIETLSDVIERREPFTANHSVRVAELVRGILTEMPDVPHELTDTIVSAARVHDLGKVATSDATLLKTGPLTAEERMEMDQHAPIGSQIVACWSISIRSSAVSGPVLSRVASLVATLPRSW